MSDFWANACIRYNLLKDKQKNSRVKKHVAALQAKRSAYEKRELIN